MASTPAVVLLSNTRKGHEQMRCRPPQSLHSEAPQSKPMKCVPRATGCAENSRTMWPPAPMVAFVAPMDDLVTVASFPDVAEAELAKERLEIEGIRAFVVGAQTAGVMPYLASATGGVRVQVQPKDIERAKEILAVS